MHKYKSKYIDIDLTDATNELLNKELPSSPNLPEVKKNTGHGNPNWVKGVSPNPNGRPKGVKNKRPTEIANFLMLVMQKNLPRLQDDLNAMSPFYRWQILEKLSRSFLPTLTASDVRQTMNGDVKIQVSFVDKNDKVQNNDDIEPIEIVE